MLSNSTFCGEQGWRSGESTHLQPMWPRFDFRTRRHVRVEFVVGSRPVLAPKGFSPGIPVFRSPQKQKSPNSNSMLVVSLISTLRQIALTPQQSALFYFLFICFRSSQFLSSGFDCFQYQLNHYPGTLAACTH